MAGIAIKALAVAALVCLVFDLAASAPSTEDLQQQQQEPAGVYEHGGDDKYPSAEPPTTPASGTFKDKLKGIVTSVKEGASGAYESVSGSVSGAAHKLDEKRKEAVAGTKKLVNGVVDKIKQKYESFKNGDDDGSDHSPEQDVPASVQQQQQQQQTAEANDYAKSALKNANVNN